MENQPVYLSADGQIFPVDRQLLLQHAPGFADVLAQQPAKVQGIPVVTLDEDISSKDLRAFSQAMSNENHFGPPPDRVRFKTVLRIVRVSHRYGAHELFKRALRHLDVVYPTSLDAMAGIKRAHLEGLSDDFTDDIRALPILESVGADWLLPYVYYCLASWSPAKLTAHRLWPQLPAVTQVRVLRVHAEQLRMHSRVNDCLAEPSECGEAFAPECNIRKLQLLRKNLTARLYNPEDPATWDTYPLDEQFDDWEDADEVKAETEVEGPLCTQCRRKLKSAHRALLVRLWAQLPANCGLPDWETLKAQREERLQ